MCSGAVFVLEWQKVRRDFVRALFFAIFSLSFYVSLSLSLPSESFPVRKLGGQRRDVWGAGEEENGYWTSLGCLKKTTILVAQKPRPLVHKREKKIVTV